MDLSLTSKLLKYSPADVHRVRYTLSYAKNNFEGDAVQDYINEHCRSTAHKEIAELLEQGNGTSNAATINGKPSAASGKIDQVKEKPSTEEPVNAQQKSIKAKGDAKSAGYKGGVEGTGTGVVNQEETHWIADVLEELGEEIDELTDEQLEDLIVEALVELPEEELNEAIESFEGDLLSEAKVTLGHDTDKGPSRAERIAGAAKRVGSALKSGASKVGSALKSGAKKAIGAAGKAAGHAAGSYDAARIKAKRTALSSASGSQTSSKPSGFSHIATGGSKTSSTGTTKSSSTPQKKGPNLLQRAGSAIKRGIKKVVGKTSRAVATGSDKLAKRLGEDNQMDNKVSRVRQILGMQETMAHDKKALDADANSWRERLGWDLEEEKTPEQKKKSAVLQRTKELTNKGKHKEASALFKKHFPNFGK